MRFLDSIRTKFILAFLVVTLVPLIGTGLYGNWITSKIISQREIVSIQSNLRQIGAQINGFLDSVKGDALYLAQLDSLQGLLRARLEGGVEGIDTQRVQVERDFLIFSEAHPPYYQLRYIAEDGQEIVRVDNHKQSKPRAIPENELQDKSNRYYFTETMKLPAGGVYVSPLDLNREHNQLEIPYTPVIRYATPVFDDQQVRRGIIIINVFSEQFLNFVQEAESRSGSLIMANQEGYYLAHPNPSLLWGGTNDLGSGERVQNDYGEQADRILSGEEGNYIDQDRVVVYTPVYPVPSGRDHYWVIFHDVSTHALFTPITRFRITAASILVFAALIALGMSMELSRQLTAPIFRLQDKVRQFGHGELDAPIAVKSNDEIGQLTETFNEMAMLIQRHIEQLAKLNKLGQLISTGLERRSTLTAIIEAAQVLFPCEYCAVRLENIEQAGQLETVIESGDHGWASHREADKLREIILCAVEESSWQAVQLEDAPGYYCCAPLSIDSKEFGIIELFGRDPFLLESTSGNLLLTLAVEASIALKNVKLYEALSVHKEQLETLVEQLINAQEEERKLVAYDLHDGLIQQLVGARLHLGEFRKLSDYASPDAERVLHEAITNLTSAVREGRHLIEGLRPSLLDTLGLATALSELAENIGKPVDWEIEFDNRIGATRLSSEIEITAFRIAQEALTNARKHAKTERVALELGCDDGWLTVIVKDFGEGFDPRTPQDQRQFGLISMRERAVLLGGTCQIDTHPGQGTRVIARLPLKD